MIGREERHSKESQDIKSCLDEISSENAALQMALQEKTAQRIAVYTETFSALTNIPIQYITQEAALNFITEKMCNSHSTNFGINDRYKVHIANPIASKYLEHSNLFFYSYIDPNTITDKTQPLFKEMQLRQSIREAILHLLKGTAIETILTNIPSQPATYIKSNKSLALYQDLIDCCNQCQSSPEGLPNIINKHSQDILKVLKKLGIYQLDAIKAFTLIRKAQLLSLGTTSSEILCCINTLPLTKQEKITLIDYINIYHQQSYGRKQVITDKLASPFFPGFYPELFNELNAFIKTQTVPSLPITEDFFSPFFKAVQDTFDTLPETVSKDSQPEDYDAPYYDLISFYTGTLETPLDKNKASTGLFEKIKDYLNISYLNQISTYIKQWKNRRENVKTSIKSYDLAKQALFYLSNNTYRIALDTNTQSRLYGTPGKHSQFLLREEKYCTMPYGDLDFLPKNQNISNLILKIQGNSDNSPLTKTGRQAFSILGLKEDCPLSSTAPRKQLIFTKPTIIQNSNATAAIDFLDSVMPFAFPTKESSINNNLEDLISFLCKTMAVPRTMDEALHSTTSIVAEHTFFKPKKNLFYTIVHKAYIKAAEKIVNTALDSIDANIQPWIIFLLQFFPSDSLLAALESVKSDHEKSVPYEISDISTFGKPRPITKIESILKSFQTVFQILNSPASSAFKTSRQDASFWKHLSQHKECYIGTQEFLDLAKKEIDNETYAGDIKSSLFLTKNILRTSGTEFLANENLGYISALYTSADNYIRHALSKKPSIINEFGQAPQIIKSVITTLLGENFIPSSSAFWRESSFHLLSSFIDQQQSFNRDDKATVAHMGLLSQLSLDILALQDGSYPNEPQGGARYLANNSSEIQAAHDLIKKLSAERPLQLTEEPLVGNNQAPFPATKKRGGFFDFNLPVSVPILRAFY